MRMGVTIFIQPGFVSPLVPDYVEKESVGKAYAYTSIASTLAFIVGSTALVEISKVVSLPAIFIAAGTFIVVVAIILMFTL